MTNAPGTFTVWRPKRRGPADPDDYVTELQAPTRERLLEMADTVTRGRHPFEAIYWEQPNGDRSTIWYRDDAKRASECWIEDVCRQAFGRGN